MFSGLPAFCSGLFYYIFGVIELKNFDGFCLNCFKRLTNGPVCTECGFDNDSQQDFMHLQRGVLLSERYLVGKHIGTTVDSLSYIGYDTALDTVVVIRELFPQNLANRLEGNSSVHIRERNRKLFSELRESFRMLWTSLKRFTNLSAIIPVTDIFEENETVYAITDKIDGISLADALERTQEVMDWEKAQLMFVPLFSSMEVLHKNGIYHAGICPENLILCRDGKVRLDNFCIKESSSYNGSISFNEHDGYTAPEQYEEKGEITASTDIYSVCACLYRALTGSIPPNAVSRKTDDKLMIPSRIAKSIPLDIIKALGSGLQLPPEKRTKEISALREALSNASVNNAPGAQKAVPEEQQTVPEAPPKFDLEEFSGYQPPEQRREKKTKRAEDKIQREKEKDKKSKIIIIVLCILLVAAIAAGVLASKSGLLAGNETTAAPSQTVQSYQVPDIAGAGYTQSDVENNANWNKWFDIVFEAEYTDKAEEGVIFRQSVTKGTTVQKGTKLVLTVSRGIETKEIVDVGGLEEDEARELLEKDGFKVSIVYVYNDGSNTAGTVKANYGMSPAAGTQYEVGKEIVLQVWEEETTKEETTEPESTTSAPVIPEVEFD